MHIKNVYYSSHFAKAFKKLPKNVQKKALKKEKIFRKNCFDSRLETHKLKGELNNCWAFSVDHSRRILFEFTENGDIGLIDIGDHSIYS